MTPDKSKTLGRIHRVRTVQLNLARATEARARAQAASETALASRIAQLAYAASSGSGNTAAFAAAAHYRDRLHQSAAAADARVRNAEAGVLRAEAATRDAKRDQTAVEKLLDRAADEAARRAARQLEALSGVPRKRHGSC